MSYSYPSPDKRNFKVLIYESEYRQIQAWVDKYQNLETGGDLFGLWKDDRTAVVQLVLGPGKQCRRSGVSFYQDVEYLDRVGNLLTNKKGLCHIGEWHSHHKLGLSRPSGGDDNTVWTNMDRYDIHRFFLFIATIDSSCVNVGCFLFEKSTERREPVLKGKIETFGIEEESLLRKNVENDLYDGAESQNSPTSLKIFITANPNKRNNEDARTTLRQPEIKRSRSNEEGKKKGDQSEKQENKDDPGTLTTSNKYAINVRPCKETENYGNQNEKTTNDHDQLNTHDSYKKNTNHSHDSPKKVNPKEFNDSKTTEESKCNATSLNRVKVTQVESKSHSDILSFNSNQPQSQPNQSEVALRQQPQTNDEYENTNDAEDQGSDGEDKHSKSSKERNKKNPKQQDKKERKVQKENEERKRKEEKTRRKEDEKGRKEEGKKKEKKEKKEEKKRKKEEKKEGKKEKKKKNQKERRRKK